MNSPFSLQFELGRAQAQLASYRVLVADESRSRREQYLAATLPGFRDRFRDLFEAVGRDNGGRDSAGSDQRTQMTEHRRDLIRLG